MQKTLRVRIKDKHAKYLRELAREVNFVFNYVNELGLKMLERSGKFPSAYDLHKYTAGATKEGLRLHSQTVQAIADEYVRRRKQFKKRRLARRPGEHPRGCLCTPLDHTSTWAQMTFVQMSKSARALVYQPV